MSAPGRICTLVVLLGALLPGRTWAVDSRKVNDAVEKGKKWLLDQQKKGNWEELPRPDPQGKPHEINGGQWGGLSAIATYALLSAGEDVKSDPMIQALKFLKTADIQGTYALGLRCQVWALLAWSPERQQLLVRDARLIREGMRTKGEARGMFDYFNDRKAAGRYDHSTSNYAVLGLWAAAENSVETSSEIWGMIEDGWRQHQAQDGSWGYVVGQGGNEATMSMTSAGVATLFITQDHLHAADYIRCAGTITDDNIARGSTWMTTNFDKFKERYPFYTLYNIERVASASGFKYFGPIDWYEQGAAWILAAQHADGSWGNIQDTCFAILFLVRGRAPVMINKLDYTPESEPGKPGLSMSWNERPRDAAHISQWVGEQMEQNLRWQIVNLKSPQSDLHEAPILYIAGRDEIKLGPDEEARLKAWVEQGGLILGNPDCDRQPFAMSFRRMGQRMFPHYEFRELPLSHPIYENEQFRASRWKMPIRVLGLSNGVRELMLIPEIDLGKSWQTQSWRGRSEAVAQFAANVFQYTIDKKNLRLRGQNHLVQREEKIQDHNTIKVARLDYGGNWDPEPWGWTRLAILMHNLYAISLQTVPLKLGEGKLDKTFTAAHLTGTGEFKLSEPQKAELKQYLQGGGTLIVDAAGGSSAFAIAAENQLNSLLSPARLDLLPPDHAVYLAAGPRLSQADFRAFAARTVGAAPRPRLQGIPLGGKTAVLFSPQDITAGLVGQSVDGIIGYTPSSATDLMQRMLLYAAGVRMTDQDLARIATMAREGVAAPPTPPTPPAAIKRQPLDISAALSKWGPVWTVANCGNGPGAGFADEFNGHKSLLVTYPIDAQTPCILSREMALPPRRAIVMHVQAGHAVGGEWTLVVRVDGAEVARKNVSPQNSTAGWTALDVDLAPFEGKKIKVELLQLGKNTPEEAAYWREVRFEIK